MDIDKVIAEARAFVEKKQKVLPHINIPAVDRVVDLIAALEQAQKHCDRYEEEHKIVWAEVREKEAANAALTQRVGELEKAAKRAKDYLFDCEEHGVIGECHPAIDILIAALSQKDEDEEKQI
jgi:hypothetical protein